MKMALQDFKLSVNRRAQANQQQAFSFSRILSAIVFATALAFAPAPAFAQHGGGGSAGGGSHGGGGSHAGGGSGGGAHASAPSSGANGSHSSGGNGANSSGGGHWWNPFHGGSSNSAEASKGGNAAAGGQVKSESEPNREVERFAAGNNIWQEPPAQAGQGTGRANYYGPSNNARAVAGPKNSARGTIAPTRETVVASPPRVFLPHRPGYPYYPYYPNYPYYGLGWGGGLWWGSYGLCDPFWGCYGYGYGYGGGFGYYGGSFSDGYSADLNYNTSQDMSSSQEGNPYLFAVPSTETNQPAAGSTSPYVMLYLKDGSTYAVTDYWLSGGRLHYVTSYGGENVIDEAQLDLQRTVNENAARGVEFTLRPEPGGGSEAPPTAPMPDGQPQAPQQ